MAVVSELSLSHLPSRYLRSESRYRLKSCQREEAHVLVSTHLILYNLEYSRAAQVVAINWRADRSAMDDQMPMRIDAGRLDGYIYFVGVGSRCPGTRSVNHTSVKPRDQPDGPELPCAWLTAQHVVCRTIPNAIAKCLWIRRSALHSFVPLLCYAPSSEQRHGVVDILSCRLSAEISIRMYRRRI